MVFSLAPKASNKSLPQILSLIHISDTIAEYELTCTDTGIGMSEEFQKRASEPFAQEGQSARTKYAGTGLGRCV